MLTSTYVNRAYYFYPIGNTPATNLLAHTSPRLATQFRLLLLGCGDLRNVLFTLFSRSSIASKHHYDFVLCDFERAIHARNVFLLTYLVRHATTIAEGEENLKHMWNVYYHFFITSADFELIQEHAWHLLQHAGTTRTWHNSPYGTLIRMCSENTLFDIRSVWQHYAENKHMRVHEEQGLAFKQGMTKVFQARIGPIATYASAVRCAGIHAFESQQVLDTAFKAYWKTGVIAGNRTDKLNLQNDQGGFANPLFAWSSAPDAGFAVHYGTDCVAGFHLAPAFDCQTSADQMLNSLVDVVQSQFYSWCRTFTQFYANVSISLFSGDAINFCHELQFSVFLEQSLPKHMHGYTKPWSAVPLHLENDWIWNHSSLYQVMDTSNLVDHVGILNVLPASLPLFDKSGASILYTGSLLSDTDKPHTTLSEQLAVDVAELSLLIGLAPMGIISGVTSDTDVFRFSVTLDRAKNYFFPAKKSTSDPALPAKLNKFRSVPV